MATVDAASTPEGEALAANYNVTGYPTLIWFVNGKPQPYDGSKNDYTDVVFWVVSQTDVITKTLTEQVFIPPPPKISNLNPQASNGKPQTSSLTM